MKMYANFVNSIFNFIANGIFGSSNSRAFLKIAIDFSNTYGIPLGGLFLVKLQAAYLPFWWKWAPSWMFLKYFAYFIIYFV